ncbi:MAG: helix-turn-helix transcriptional regulator [Lachnospiraceae bacterium]|nr:helix-turn-helix transcriptional regulator [Lachnospiraceae bacterium]
MLQEAKQFGEFLTRQREEKQVARDALGEGLFLPNQMGKVERGERYPQKPVRDRLLSRLGESGVDYECFLQSDEYEDWEERRNILDCLDKLELDRAEQLLMSYEEKHGNENPVSGQFLLTMRVQWMELKNVPETERSLLLEQAVKLTIPNIDTKPVAELVLSIQELNLVLEYEAYKNPEGLQPLCLQLLQYLEKARFDPEARAMLGSKIALYYCNKESGIEENGAGIIEQVQRVKQALEICTAAIDKLRDKHKIYFAWELLRKKEQYISWLLKHETLFSGNQIEQYREELAQTRQFYEVIDCLYERFQVSKQTNNFTCFYREHEVYCINDVIRARRRMLGITTEELEQICGRRTLIRLEAGETKVQRSVACNLFSHLGLSPELHRAQIITDNQEALRVEERFRREENQRNFEEAERLLQQLKSMISLTDKTNLQYTYFVEKVLTYQKKELSKESLIQYAKEALELTIPLETAMMEIKDRKLPNGRVWSGEKYLTNMEVTILDNIAGQKGNNIANEYWEVVKEYFEWLEKKCTLSPILGMYGFVMSSVASWLGNLHRFDEANALNRKMLKELLRTRNFNYVRRNLYGLLWNYMEQNGLPMKKGNPEWKKGLLECLAVDVFNKDEWCAAKMRERLEK